MLKSVYENGGFYIGKYEAGTETADLKSNSSGWGNYYDHSFTINRGEYSISSPWINFIPYTTTTENIVTVTGSGENLISQKIGTASNNWILLTTGASEDNSKENIYDLARSVFEWTLEKAHDYPCTDRGGNFSRIGSDYPVSKHGYNDISKSSSSIGFRVSLY